MMMIIRYKFWADECIEFNYDWLTKELEIDPDEITFIEDVWAGGGNLGPSIEYFVGGLELGNMVFMQFKTFPDGRREPLQVQVIDVGIGLERVPWLINGSATSYMDVFPSALKVFQSRIDIPVTSPVWEKYGPYSCLLNVDEVEDLDKTWAFIAEKADMKAPEVKAAIEPVRDAYIILDHTRSIFMVCDDLFSISVLSLVVCCGSSPAVCLLLITGRVGWFITVESGWCGEHPQSVTSCVCDFGQTRMGQKTEYGRRGQKTGAHGRSVPDL